LLDGVEVRAVSGKVSQFGACRNVSTTLRQPSVEFKLGFLEFSSVN